MNRTRETHSDTKAGMKRIVLLSAFFAGGIAGAAIVAMILLLAVFSFVNVLCLLPGQDADPTLALVIVMVCCGPAIALMGFVAGGRAFMGYVARRVNRRRRGFEVIIGDAAMRRAIPVSDLGLRR
jgi:hypothetical protein